MKRVAADQSVIDRAIALQDEGKTDAEIARELNVSGSAPNNWRKQGRLPERKKKTNNGKVRKFEDLPELKPGQRLDGTPMLNTEGWKVFKLEETPAAKAPEPAVKTVNLPFMEPAKTAEPAEEPVKVQKPVEEKKARLTRSMTLRGEFLEMSVNTENRVTFGLAPLSDLAALDAKQAAEVLMDMELDVRALIAEVEKLL